MLIKCMCQLFPDISLNKTVQLYQAVFEKKNDAAMERAYGPYKLLLAAYLRQDERQLLTRGCV